MDDRNELNRERPRSSLNLIVHEFLCQRVPEYVLLENVRAEGWASTSGDAYFQRQRKSADNANSRTQKYFFKMMQSISKEMDDTTGIMSCLDVENGSAEVLDLCMAPGGFSDAVLQYYSTVRISGISLPAGLGGHHVLLDLSDPRIRIEFTDITMLSSEMGTSVIPDNHPDAGRFSQHRPFANDSFNLVICDGHVLRTHPREPYREGVEMSRLITSQLVFGLHRIRPGGTLVILLHKLENWKSLKLLYTFSQFSKIQLFKPRHHHAIRSSFYLVATHVQPHMESAISAIENWKRTWFSATFGLRCEEAPPEHGIELILEEFGGRFIEVGKPVWRIQLEALRQSKFIQSSRKTAEIERARDR